MTQSLTTVALLVVKVSWCPLYLTKDSLIARKALEFRHRRVCLCRSTGSLKHTNTGILERSLAALLFSLA